MTDYRFWLDRMWLGEKPAVFVMLNPSTAADTTDDPTIRRCISFAAREGYGRLIVVNLYGARATEPADLWRHDDPVGGSSDLLAGNDAAIRAALTVASDEGDGRIICAWGANAKPDRVAEFVALSAGNVLPVTLWCLGMTLQGAPRHPLYVRADQPLTPWPGGAS